MTNRTHIANRRAFLGGAALLGAGGAVATASAAGEQRGPRMLEGLTALVTGAARGIGRAAAVALARQGANVALIDSARDIESIAYRLGTPADLAETRRLVEAAGSRAMTIRCDVRDLPALRSAVADTVAAFGRIDIAMPNAGVLTMAPLVEMSEPQWDDVIAINLSGVARTMMAVLPVMRRQQSGRIIVTASCNGRAGSAGSPSYNASKWGVIGLVKSVAVEEARNGITVNCVNPTGVATPMSLQPAYVEAFRTHLGTFNAQDRTFLEPDEIAAAMLFFASPAASVITGEALDVAAGANTRWGA